MTGRVIGGERENERPMSRCKCSDRMRMEEVNKENVIYSPIKKETNLSDNYTISCHLRLINVL